MTRPTASYVASLLAVQLEVAEEHVVPTALLYADLRALPLALVRASIAIEDAFGISIPDEALARVVTVEDFMALVAKRSRDRRAPRRLRRGRWA